eukprot:5378026-Pleurochrysis_carterae.AAC.2
MAIGGDAQAEVLQAHGVRQLHLEKALLRAALAIRLAGWLLANQEEFVVPAVLQHTHLAGVAVRPARPAPRDQLYLPLFTLFLNRVDVADAVHEVTVA